MQQVFPQSSLNWTIMNCWNNIWGNETSMELESIEFWPMFNSKMTFQVTWPMWPNRVRSKVDGSKGWKWIVFEVNGRAKVDGLSKNGRSWVKLDGPSTVQNAIGRSRVKVGLWVLPFPPSSFNPLESPVFAFWPFTFKFQESPLSQTDDFDSFGSFSSMTVNFQAFVPSSKTPMDRLL